MEATEGVFLQLSKKDVETIDKVLATLGLDYSPNGIVRAFYILDKWLEVKNVITGKGNIINVLKNFAN